MKSFSHPTSFYEPFHARYKTGHGDIVKSKNDRFLAIVCFL
jgi:hypothetical protein